MLVHEVWHDQPALRWSMNKIELVVLQNAGPRIVNLQRNGAPSMLAEVPHFAIPHPENAQSFKVWGGHRLWLAPEVPAITYLPDDQPVALSEIDATLTIRGVPNHFGVQKIMVVSVDDDQRISVEHRLINHSDQPFECAAWAITQFKLGGVAILPQPSTPLDSAGLQANRTLAFWPYSDLTHPNLDLGQRWITVKAEYAGDEMFKIGWPNRVGWLAYYWQGQLFTKTAQFHADATYYDGNSSSECYSDQFSLELETLSPRTILAPKSSLSHHEIWTIQPFKLPDYSETTLDRMFGHLV